MLAIICLTALGASLLTLFSGFGLGTLLLPAFALFFPLDASIAMTAVVHFANNLFKLALLGSKADRQVVLRFGLPAVAASFLGAQALLWLSGLPALASYAALGRTFDISAVKLVIAALMLAFSALEWIPSLKDAGFDRRYLPLGGVLSGFFGGLSGHQGALRSAFLIRCGLSQEAFVATGIVAACLVDLARLAVYARHLASLDLSGKAGLLAAATACAFAGAWLGSRLLKKATLGAVRRVVTATLVLFSIALGAGVI